MSVERKEYRRYMQEALKSLIEAQVSGLDFHAPVPSDRTFPYITPQKYNEDDQSTADSASWWVTPHLMIRDGGPVDAFNDDQVHDKASDVEHALSTNDLAIGGPFTADLDRIDTDDSPRRYEDEKVFKSVLILPRYLLQYTP